MTEPIKSHLCCSVIAWCLRLSEFQHNITVLSTGNGDISSVTDFADCMWCTIITFTTIGYGDFYPLSNWGRTFCVSLGVTGAVFTAILVALVTDKLQFTRREYMINRVLNTDNQDKELRNQAATGIKKAIKLYIANKNRADARENKAYKTSPGDCFQIKMFGQLISRR